jgi:hypothetical protein
VAESDPNEPVVLVHPKLPDGEPWTAVNAEQAQVFMDLGWKRQSKAAAAKTEEK